MSIFQFLATYFNDSRLKYDSETENRGWNAQCGYRGGHAYIGSQEQARDLKFAPDIPF